MNTLTPRLRKLALTAHVTSSVGWLGAVVAYLGLAIAGLTKQDAEFARVAYPALEWMAWYVIMPFSVAALVTGLIESLGTERGLVRYYWVLAKLALTVVATTILLLHLPAVSAMAALVATAPVAGYGELPLKLVVHAGGGLLVLITATVLSIYKPWGKTRYASSPGAGLSEALRSLASRDVPWAQLAVMGIVGMVLVLVVAMHLAGVAPHGH